MCIRCTLAKLLGLYDAPRAAYEHLDAGSVGESVAGATRTAIW